MSDQEKYEAYHASHAQVSGGHDRTRSAPEYESLVAQGEAAQGSRQEEIAEDPADALAHASETPEVGPQNKASTAPKESKGNRTKATASKTKARRS